MYTLHMALQHSDTFKSTFTVGAFERFIFCMNSCDTFIVKIGMLNMFVNLCQGRLRNNVHFKAHLKH